MPTGTEIIRRIGQVELDRVHYLCQFSDNLGGADSLSAEQIMVLKRIDNELCWLRQFLPR